MTPAVHLGVILMTPLVPLLLAVGLMLAPGSRSLQRASVLAPVPALATSLLMPPGIGATLPWLLEGSEFGLDPTGRVFLLFSSAIWLAAALHAATFVAAEHRGRFLVFFLLAMSGNLGAIVARDMLAFYLFFSLMSFAAYGLVVHDRRAESRHAGAWYLGLVVASDMMLYAALVPAALDAGSSVMLAEVRETISESPHRDMIIALIVAGFGVKAGAIGVHLALPMIYRTAPLSAGAAFAGAMLHLGVLGWLRFLPVGAELPQWGRVLLVAGLAGTFYGALVGCAQRDPRAVLAYSSISQVGIMLAGVGAALLAPERASGIAAALTLYALHHAFAKSALFLGFGIASRAVGGRVASLALRVGLLLPALALPGLPLTSGARAKEYLKEQAAAADAGSVAAFAELLPFTAVATTLVVARFLWLVWPLTSPRSAVDGPSLRRPTAAETAAWAAMLALALTAVWIQPIRTPPELWTAAVLWELTWPAGAGALLAWLTAKGVAAGRLPPAPSVPPGDLALPIERGLRRAGAAWRRAASGPLPRARNAVRNVSTMVLADRRWAASASAAERVLARWGTATSAFVLISIVLAFLLLASAV